MLPTIRELLEESVDIYRRHAQTYIGYSAWLLVTFAAAILLTFIPEESLLVPVGAIAISLGEMLLAIWITSILILFTHAVLKGESKDAIVLQDRVRNWFAPIILVVILQTLAQIAGFILLIIPGIIFSVWYAFALPVSLIEQKHGIDALSESKALSHGRFGAVAYRYLGGSLLLMLVYLLVLGAASSLGGLFSGGVDLLFQNPSTALWIGLLDAILEILFLPIFIIFFMVLFDALRATKPTTSAS